MLPPFNLLADIFRKCLPVQQRSYSCPYNLPQKGALAGTGYAGEANQSAKGYGYFNIL